MSATEYESDPDKVASQNSDHRRWHLKNGTTMEGYRQLVLAYHRWKRNSPQFLLEARNNPKSDVGKAYLNEKRLTREVHDKPVSLYRGISGTHETPGRQLQSWTDDKKQAQWWAEHGNPLKSGKGKVLERTFPPDKIVSSYRSSGNVSKAEREFIVDNRN